jgi:hypothetical protein
MNVTDKDANTSFGLTKFDLNCKPQQLFTFRQALVQSSLHRGVVGKEAVLGIVQPTRLGFFLQRFHNVRQLAPVGGLVCLVGFPDTNPAEETPFGAANSER